MRQAWSRDPLLSLLAALTALSSLALGLTGEVTPLSLAIPPLALAAPWIHARGFRAGRGVELAFRVAGVSFLLYFVACVLTLRLLPGAVALTVPAQAYLLALPPALDVRRRLAIMSFFQLVALAASTTQVFFLPVLLGWVLAAPPLLTVLSLEMARGPGAPPLRIPLPLARAGATVSLALLVLAAFGFVALPRYEAGMFRQLAQDAGHVSGFSERVALGDIESIRRSDKVVMHVRTSGELRGPLRWRGIALDRFTGREWSASPSQRRSIWGEGRLDLVTPPRDGVTLRQEFSVEPMGTAAVFHAGYAVAIESATFVALERDAWGNLSRVLMPGGRQRYVVESRSGHAAADVLDPTMQELCLQLPDQDPRVHELAVSLAGGAGDDAGRARAVERALRDGWTYSLDVNDRGVERPVERFLLEKAPGHCEYFASGMVVMLRNLGIPSRVVTGFLPGETSTFFRSHVVRERDAHAWVEAWLPGRGWTTFDPTPPEPPRRAGVLGLAGEAWRQVRLAWDDNVIGFSSTLQVGLLITLREWAGEASAALRRLPLPRVTATHALGALTIVSAGLLAWVVLAWRREVRAAGPRVRFYARALDLAARRGLRRRDGQTPAELAREAAALRDPGAPALGELTALYYAERFGGVAADRRRVAALLAALERAPRRR